MEGGGWRVEGGGGGGEASEEKTEGQRMQAARSPGSVDSPKRARRLCARGREKARGPTPRATLDWCETTAPADPPGTWIELAERHGRMPSSLPPFAGPEMRGGRGLKCEADGARV